MVFRDRDKVGDSVCLVPVVQSDETDKRGVRQGPRVRVVSGVVVGE